MSSLHDLVKNRPFIPWVRSANFILSFKGYLLNIEHQDGGAERDRTADPLLAKQVLSQLSYSPISWVNPTKPRLHRRSGGPGKT